MNKPVELSPEGRQAAAARLRTLLAEELEVEIGTLQAELLLDQIARDLGPLFYNRALADARTVVAARAEDMDEALYGLQRQTELR
ncbi:DUF2164 domain-containing protein [Brevundimonas sp.]|uniref:DUF2164 domain-containing protein n=1 Tax=Brevundimonas sp. TaxID=1871086 RepID=UPI002D63B895|nr:DUF2164 domain-containing protein [Brevundimonas sp.]HYC75345.1 DUF2164 domain-containing protein [Brevundimonas sp.]